MLDVVCALALLLLAAATAVAYAVWRRRHGEASFARVERDGGSPLLGRGTMAAAYWALQPLGDALVRAGVSANAITLSSLALGFAGGVAFATGHFGLAALVAAVAALGDALDGLVARATGTASRAGEVLDATVDRYQEFAFFGGIAVAWRGHLPGLLLALGAALGATMVSYASARAEPLRGRVPRGVMRRAERAVYVITAATLTPLASLAVRRFDLPPSLEIAPMAAALALIAVAGNASAVHRLWVLARLGPDGALRTHPPDPPWRTEFVRLFSRHQVGAAIGTVVDYGAMILLVSGLGVDPVSATAVGAASGGLTNFLLGRRWVFSATEGPIASQATRYALVSATSLGLNVLGEYLLAVHCGGHYVAARVATSLVVTVAWNFPMQRHFVFAEHPHQETLP